MNRKKTWLKICDFFSFFVNTSNFWKSYNEHDIENFLNEWESTFNSVVGVVTPKVAFILRKKNQFRKKTTKKDFNSEGKWERNKTTAPWCKKYEWDNVVKKSGVGMKWFAKNVNIGIKKITGNFSIFSVSLWITSEKAFMSSPTKIF